MYCTLVSIFGFLSPLCVSLLSCCINYKKRQNSYQNPKWLMILNVFCHYFPLAPVARIAELLYHAKNCHHEDDNCVLERKYEHYKWKDKIQAFLLNFEMFVESSPQLLLKICILFNEEGTLSFTWSVVGLLFGFLASAWRLTSNRKSGNLSNDNERHLSKKHISLLFAHHLLSLCSRFMLLGMLSALSVRGFGIFCGLHTVLICLILSFHKFYLCRAVFKWKEKESSWAQDAFGIVKVILSSLFCLTDFRFKRAFKLHTTTFCVIPLGVNIALIVYFLTSTDPLVLPLLCGFFLMASLGGTFFYFKCNDLGLGINGTETRDRQGAVLSVTATLKRNCIFIDKAIERCRRSLSRNEESHITRRNSSIPEDVVVHGQRKENLSEGSAYQRRQGNKAWKNVDELLRDGDLPDEAKAAINRKDVNWVCQNMRRNLFQVLTLMLAVNGTNLNTRDKRGVTPTLELCCFYDREDLPKILELLIVKGADVKAVDQNGETMLHLVCENYSRRNLKDIVDLLIKAGVPVDAKDHFGNTVLHSLARKYKHESTKDIIDVLINAGTPVEAKDVYGETALLLVTRPYKHYNMKDIVDILNEVPVDAIVNKNGDTVLHLVAGKYKHDNLEEIVRLLKTKGSRLDVLNRKGLTPLIAFCRYNIKYLTKINQLENIRVFKLLTPDASDDPLLSNTQSITRLREEFDKLKIHRDNLNPALSIELLELELKYSSLTRGTNLKLPWAGWRTILQAHRKRPEKVPKSGFSIRRITDKAHLGGNTVLNPSPP